MDDNLQQGGDGAAVCDHCQSPDHTTDNHPAEGGDAMPAGDSPAPAEGDNMGGEEKPAEGDAPASDGQVPSGETPAGQ